MTELALSCALLELPVDPHRLYTEDDQLFFLWLQNIVEQVVMARRKASKNAQ